VESPNVYYVYILQVRNGNYYTGSTSDIRRRYAEHLCGTRRSRYTRSFPPLRLSRCWRVHGSWGDTLRIEHLIKKGSRRTKISLIRDPHSLTPLLKRRNITDVHVEPCGESMIGEINEKDIERPPGKGGKTRGSP
jgi:putative endonuclease